MEGATNVQQCDSASVQLRHIQTNKSTSFSRGNIYSVTISDMPLQDALGLLKFPDSSKLLEKLDNSLIAIVSGKSSIEEHDKLFNALVKKPYRQLSLKYHSDKNKESDDKQTGLNAVSSAMEVLHDYCKKNNNFRYKLCADIAVNFVKDDKVNNFIDPNVLCVLRSLSSWRENGLVVHRNKFLKHAKRIISDFHNNLNIIYHYRVRSDVMKP